MIKKLENMRRDKEKVYMEFAGLKFVVEDIESTLENIGIGEFNEQINMLVNQKLVMEKVRRANKLFINDIL